MAFEDLSHTPAFELPDYAPPITPDALGLIEEWHQGLHRVVVSKQMRRDSYELVATITVQEGGNSKTHPSARPDDIAEYVMLCIQWEIERSDSPGVYRMKLFGAPGKGRFDKSKHIDTRGDGDARDIHVLTEGELNEQQAQYIGELHSQIVAQNEILMGMVGPLLQRNNEMMKIQGDVVKNSAELESVRNKHAIEMKIHNDEMKAREEESDQKMKRWMELLGVVKESGATEAIFKALAKKLNQSAEESGERVRKANEEKEEENADSYEAETGPKELEVAADSLPKKKKKKKKSSTDAAPKKKKKKKKKTTEGESSRVFSGERAEAAEEVEDEFIREGLAMVEQSPLVLCAQGLKMTIEDKDQWSLIEGILTKDQYAQLISITESSSDEDLIQKMKELYDMRGMKRLLKLGDHLDEGQTRFMDELVKAAISK